MSEIRTRDEALAAIDRALTRWTAVAGGVLAQAVVAAHGAHAAAEAETARRVQRVAALEALLSALPTDSPRHAQVQRELVDAWQSLEAARRATRLMADVARQVTRLQRSHARHAEARVTAARADLSTRVTALDAYRAVGGGAGEGGSITVGPVGASGPAGAAFAPMAVSPRQPPAGSASAAWLADRGLADIGVAGADYADNPITGAFGRGGHTRADYRWALTTWDQVIRPGLDRGMSRADFAARDAARDATPSRRTADVYDMFLGTDPVRVERRPDGTLNVINGRHRLAVARELGISYLPAHVSGP